MIIFPKSISDIGYYLIANFAERLAPDDLMSKICVINSKRGASIDDTNYASSFCKMLCRRFGYKSRTETFVLTEEKRFEDLLENKFQFNTVIGRYLENLTAPCIFEGCPRLEECKNIFCRWPMRRINNIQPEIYYLEK